MTRQKLYIVIFIIIVLLLIFLYVHKENFSGALLQLYAKGPQDYYLTGDGDTFPYYYPVYNPYYYPYYVYPSIWNQPTSFKGRNTAPYLALTPERYYLY
jgi:hypothetical protein